jgi:hypothetical protein
LKFLDIVKLKTLAIVYKAKNEQLPENIQSLFLKSIDVHTHNTRSSSKGNFNVKFCRTRLKSMSISIVGVKLWNQLSVDLHDVSFVSLFRKKLKKYFLSNY